MIVVVPVAYRATEGHCWCPTLRIAAGACVAGSLS